MISDQGQAHSAYGHSMAAAGGCGSGGQQIMAARLHSSASPHSCTIPTHAALSTCRSHTPPLLPPPSILHSVVVRLQLSAAAVAMLFHPVLALRLLLLACIALLSLNAASALEPVPASSVTVCHADDPTCATPVIVKPLVQDRCLVPTFLPGAVLYSCSGLVATAYYFAPGVASDCSLANLGLATAVASASSDGASILSVASGGVQYEYLRINCYAPQPASAVTVCLADDPTCATPVIVKPLVQDTCLVPSFLPGAVLYSCSGLVATAYYFAPGVAPDCSPDNTSQATAVSFGPFDGSAPISVSAGGVQYEYLRINCYAAQQASAVTVCHADDPTCAAPAIVKPLVQDTCLVPTFLPGAVLYSCSGSLAYAWYFNTSVAAQCSLSSQALATAVSFGPGDGSATISVSSGGVQYEYLRINCLAPQPASSVTVCHADDPTCATPVIVKPLVQDTCLVPSFLPGAVLYSCDTAGLASAYYFNASVASQCSQSTLSLATAVGFSASGGSQILSVNKGGVQYEYLRINCLAPQPNGTVTTCSPTDPYCQAPVSTAEALQQSACFTPPGLPGSALIVCEGGLDTYYYFSSPDSCSLAAISNATAQGFGQGDGSQIYAVAGGGVTYEFVRVSCSAAVSPSSVLGDPQFVGLLGQSFQVHGLDGGIYNLVSDAAFNLNARFTFLSGPAACPVVPSTGRRSSACFSHPGSYLSAVGLVTTAGVRVEVVAGAASTGFQSVTVDGRVLAVGEAAGGAAWLSTHEARLSVGRWTVELENSDGFLNLRSVAVTGALHTLGSHGLIGQTWRATGHSGSLHVIEGEVDDYLEAANDLLGSQFLFNRMAAAS